MSATAPSTLPCLRRAPRHSGGRWAIGSCTSISISSWPRWRSCAARSWPAGRWSSAAMGTRTGRGRWSRRRPTRRVRSACGRGCRCGQAARRCPDAVFLPSDRPAYDAASARVMTTLRSFPVDGGGVGVGRSVRGRPHRRPRGVRPGSCRCVCSPRPG